MPFIVEFQLLFMKPIHRNFTWVKLRAAEHDRLRNQTFFSHATYKSSKFLKCLKPSSK